MHALFFLLLLAAQPPSGIGVTVTQLNRPTVEDYGAATIVFGIDVANNTSDAVEIKRLDFDLPYTASGDWTLNRQRFVMHRTIAPGATVRIPVLREKVAGLDGRATARVEVTIATVSGERVATLLQPMQIRIDRAVRVHR